MNLNIDHTSLKALSRRIVDLKTRNRVKSSKVEVAKFLIGSLSERTSRVERNSIALSSRIETTSSLNRKLRARRTSIARWKHTGSRAAIKISVRTLQPTITIIVTKRLDNELESYFAKTSEPEAAPKV